ncbi:hypothetical protein [Mesorhizobium sp. ES1-1]|uniref:hypothetical protein n=1 Tax=Mesorhizobium sp. ES1-1 TaxID=2876629 RepID=UPI001CC9F2EC|nr:hypothetical protein [Mesorhizobium sp. ES1-1]MBZ9674527.1 hypothetical protein [Mesorhizobium sp. ES1-1]
MKRIGIVAKSAALVVLMLLTLISSSFAQSAEQTVVYMMHGVDADPVTNYGGGHTVILKPVESPSGVDFIVDGLLSISARYKQIDGCHYTTNVSIAMEKDKPLVEIMHGVLDWSKVASVKLTTPVGTPAGSLVKQLSIDGLAVSECKGLERDGTWSDCKVADVLRAMNVGDPERATKAYDYFKKNFCAGSAF